MTDLVFLEEDQQICAWYNQKLHPFQNTNYIQLPWLPFLKIFFYSFILIVHLLEAKFILSTSVSTIKSTIFKPELYWCFKPELYRRIVKILYFISLDMLIPVYITQYIYFLLTMIKKHPDDVKMHA